MKARSLQDFASRAAIGNEHLRSLGRSRGTNVGREVHQRNIDIVPHRADDRNAAHSNGTHHGLVIEGTQIVRRTSAAPDDDGVHLWDARQIRERPANGFWCPRPLNQRGREEDVGAAAAKRHTADIVNDGARGARHDADDARLERKGSLALRREQTFRRKLCLQSLERLEERPASCRLRAVGDELESAARGPERRLAAQSYACAVDQEGPHTRRDVRPVHDNVDGRVLVLILQAEIEVTAGGGTHAGHLALNPHRHRETSFERTLDRAIECSHGQRMFRIGTRARRRFRFAGAGNIVRSGLTSVLRRRRAHGEIKGEVARNGHWIFSFSTQHGQSACVLSLPCQMRYYVTTPIYYVNDVPHLGTAYTTIVVDAIRRYHQLRGHVTRMLTGTDEHGLKLEREAQNRGILPATFVSEMSDRFEAAWPKLEVRADDFLRTTQPRHERLVQDLWRAIRDRGDLYLGDYEEWYCVGCEGYKTEKELLPGNVCPLHLRPVERMKEETYLFRLSRFQERLLELYARQPGFIEPESRRNEVISFVEGGLKDLSVSRTSFSWGIPVPDDPKHVMYVWFDALANYWTAVQSPPELRAFWNDGTVVHVVGKDILRFHAVYWPAFLMSAGLPLPSKVYAHGFLTFGGQKMSKSLRNAADPLGIAHALGEAMRANDDAGADVLRYQLLRAIALGQDGDFDPASMVERYNADLGKNLGNLLARTLGLCIKMTGTRVPARGELSPLERDLFAKVDEARANALKAWDDIEPHRALEWTWVISSAANQYVDRAAPWAEDKQGNRGRVGTILHTLLSVLGLLAKLVWPAMPNRSDEMHRQLGLAPLQPAVDRDWLSAARETRSEGEPLTPGSPLFPTFDESAGAALVAAVTPRIGDGGPASTAPNSDVAIPAVAAVPAASGTDVASISYDEFSAVDLRVGIVRDATRVPRKDKLLALTVDLGEEAPRSIVAGLALSFKPEDLLARRVVVVANLAPRDFGKGLVSHGMILATGPSDQLALATVEGNAKPGARLK